MNMMFERDIYYFKIFGTINLESNSTSSCVYVGVIFVAVCLQLASCLTDTYLVFGDIDRMVDNMAISLTFVYGVFKFAVIFYIRPEIEQLIDRLEQLEREREQLEDREYKPSLMGHIALRFDDYARVYLRFVLFVAATWYLQPLLQMRRLLPFPGTRYPYSLQSLSSYLLTYLVQVCSNLYLLLYVAALDLFVLKAIAHTCSQLHALRCRLEHGGGEQLRLCVMHHERLYEVCGVLGRCLSSVLASQFAYNLATLCFAILALAKRDRLDLSALNLATFLALANVEMFVFCWFSQQLADYSEAVSDGAYSSRWECGPAETRASLCLLMCRSRRRVQLMAAGIFPVSVVTYVSIVRTSFSYYTILKQLNGSKDI